MKTTDLQSISQVAEECEVYRQTIQDLLRTRQIETHAMPRNRKARGIDAAGRREIRKALGIPSRLASAN